ncbi:sulfatase-like hydrolase/transferase [Coraliomargarita sp. W4R53]
MSLMSSNGLIASESNNSKEQTKPNVLLILVDDLGFGDVGFNGSTEIPTPHIDSIASNGVHFTNGHVTAPQCAPSRAGLHAGIDQNRFNRGNNELIDTLGMPQDVQMFAEYMKEAGYRTALVGKWHLGTNTEAHPLERGFDWFYGHLVGATYFLPPNNTDSIPNIFENKTPQKVTDYLTFVLGEKAIDFIEQDSEDPFFLFLSYNAPHAPLQAPEQYLEKFRHLAVDNGQVYVPRVKTRYPRHIYAAMVSALDDSIGQVMQALRDNGMEENTIVWFLSDNGGPTTVTGADNAPLRGVKGDLLEGGSRVPFALQWKNTIPAGQTINTPVSSLDILPSSMSAAGMVIPEELDGANLLPMSIEGEALAQRSIISYFPFPDHYPVFSVRRDDWKLVAEVSRGKDLIGWAPDRGGKVGLYRIDKDIKEENDLSEQYPEIRQGLQAEYDAWKKTLPTSE